jgi:hypothetical protein
MNTEGRSLTLKKLGFALLYPEQGFQASFEKLKMNFRGIFSTRIF